MTGPGEGAVNREGHWVAQIESWLARGAPAKAVEIALSATSALPSSERLLGLLGLSRLNNGDFAEAGAAVEQLWSLAPTNLGALTTIGQVAAAVENHELGRAAFERAVQLRPDDPQLQFNLATSLRNFGELSRAEALYDSVIERRPDDWEAYKNRSELRRQTSRRNHIQDIQAAIARAGGDWRGAVMLHYALGKEREDLSDYDGAFAAFDAGAKLRRSHIDYNVEADLDRMSCIARVFDGAWLKSQTAGCQSAEPIFVMGLPRAGSTLLERMLGAHPAVFAAGELQNFGISTIRLVKEPGQAQPVDFIAAAARLDPRQLGETYLASTRPRTGGSARFIDKLPGNFLYAALIAAALPKAALIHIHRNPRDAGFGMYKTLFRQGYPFSYDLREISRYILGYQALMQHWRDAMPGRIIDVSYDDLVDDSERVVKDILKFCGLSFDPACLSFFNSADPSSTASAVQVREPVYRTSLEAWRRYARHLGPMLDLLDGPALR